MKGNMKKLGAGIGLVCLVLLALVMPISAQTNITVVGKVALGWDPWTPQEAPLVGGVRIYYGAYTGLYTNSVSFEPCCTGVLENLPLNVPLYFAAKAFSATNDTMESEFSNEISFVITNLPGTNIIVFLGPPGGFRITGIEIGTVTNVVEEPPTNAPCTIVRATNRGAETYATTWPSGATYMATPFSASTNNEVCEAQIPLIYKGGLTGEVYASIWTGSRPTTQSGGESEPLPLAFLPVGTNVVTFTFTEPAQIQAGTTNWVVLRGASFWGPVNNLAWSRNDRAATTMGVFYSASGTNWPSSTLYRRSCFTLLGR